MFSTDGKGNKEEIRYKFKGDSIDGNGVLDVLKRANTHFSKQNDDINHSDIIHITVTHPHIENKYMYDFPGIVYNKNYETIVRNYESHIKTHDSAIIMLCLTGNPEESHAFKMSTDFKIDIKKE